tara:strand:- start:479 stop:1180 length:702 start_codon:yes stop_codon:yes gene_type:complete
MKIAIMQPYFLPYLGYWQLVKCVDKMIIYDNIKYTKKGWINRNRLLFSGRSSYVTIPIKKGSDFLEIRSREISERWSFEKIKILNKINANYNKSPNFDITYNLVEDIFSYESDNLYDFIFNSINKISNFLDIQTALTKSSNINIDHNLKSKRKILAICCALEADVYINPIGGISLYQKVFFQSNHIKLLFLKTDDIKYKQFGEKFEPSLSIIDILMFNKINIVKNYLNQYKLV